MNKLLLILLCLPLLFSTCKKEDENNYNPNNPSASQDIDIIIGKRWSHTGNGNFNNIANGFLLSNNEKIYFINDDDCQHITIGSWEIEEAIDIVIKYEDEATGATQILGTITQFNSNSLTLYLDSIEYVFSSSSTANCTYVPDDNFEQVLISLGYDDILDDFVTTENINTVTFLGLYNENISDLTGIEDFTALTSLGCDANNLTTLDLSGNTLLTILRCASNSLISIDVSNNTTLATLVCSDNYLTSLDVSGATALTGLNCMGNLLSSLNVSNNTALTVLRCEDNNLTSLDLRNGNNTNFTEFISTNNPNLTCINVDDVTFSTTNWTDIDLQHDFSTNCL